MKSEQIRLAGVMGWHTGVDDLGQELSERTRCRVEAGGNPHHECGNGSIQAALQI